jgi:predicted O-methyltransferase YrrM
MPEYTVEQLQPYLDSLVPARPAEVEKMEAYARQHDFPIIGPASGQMCYQVARLIEAKRIFEMGSGYGYSTLWFAKAVQENGGGTVYHVVWDDKLSQMARGHLDVLGYTDLIQYHVGEATEALHQTEGLFDLIFNDIDKHGYPASLPIIKEKLRPGGVLIIDNMIFHGAIFDDNNQSPSKKGVVEFTRLITTDPDWIVSLLPIRDGLIVAYKK